MKALSDKKVCSLINKVFQDSKNIEDKEKRELFVSTKRNDIYVLAGYEKNGSFEIPFDVAKNTL